MILMMRAVLRLLFILLATPQTGVPFAAPGGDPSKTLSAIDAVSLTSLLFILTAELIVLAFSLWLLFRATRPSAENADARPSD
jgi:Zn-dependent protease with chaperone function